MNLFQIVVCSIIPSFVFDYFLHDIWQDQMNIETKIRNIRFIGELCKFRIAPAGLVFSCLKVMYRSLVSWYFYWTFLCVRLCVSL